MVGFKLPAECAPCWAAVMAFFSPTLVLSGVNVDQCIWTLEPMLRHQWFWTVKNKWRKQKYEELT